MLTKKELEEYARLKGINLGNAEKDYLLDVALLSISRNTKNELVFKGGTCLYKFHKLGRFSEDLDFSLAKKIDAEKLVDSVVMDFEKFGLRARTQQRIAPSDSIIITMKIEGPLFAGTSQAYSNLGIDINTNSPVFLEPETLSYSPLYRDIPMINSFCMKQEEIFAEKIRAILTRQRARDLFDLNFLLHKGIHSDFGLISKKMDYYNEKFDINKIIKKLSSLERQWKKELAGLTSNLPDFRQVKEDAIKKLKKLYS